MDEALWPSPLQVHLIQHSFRYADLRLMMYWPSCLEAEAQQGADGCSGRYELPVLERVASLAGKPSTPGHSGASQATFFGRLGQLNPLAVLTLQDLAAGRFPPELSLEPANVEELYDGMADGMASHVAAAAAAGDGPSAWAAQQMAELAALSPEAFFATSQEACSGLGPFLTRDVVRKYEAAVKGMLLRWASGSSQEGTAAAAAAPQAIHARCGYQPPPELTACLAEGRALTGLALDLLREKLPPCLVFCFERATCHYLAKEVVRYLEVTWGDPCLSSLQGGCSRLPAPSQMPSQPSSASERPLPRLMGPCTAASIRTCFRSASGQSGPATLTSTRSCGRQPRRQLMQRATRRTALPRSATSGQQSRRAWIWRRWRRLLPTMTVHHCPSTALPVGSTVACRRWLLLKCTSVRILPTKPTHGPCPHLSARQGQALVGSRAD